MKLPLQDSSFQLDVSGIAGFFGGEEAFAAMSSVHLVRGRRWLGFYNSPGSYFVAKKYGVLARSRFWDGLYPGVNVEPTRMLELDGKTGPRYIGLRSGTRLQTTGHLAYLLEHLCSEERKEVAERFKFREKHNNPFPRTSTSDIEGGPTIWRKKEKRESEIVLTIAHLDEFREAEEYLEAPAHSFSLYTMIAFIAVGYSFGACVLCGIFRDWFCFAMILLGIVSNGISCFIIGSGKLRIEVTNPSPNSPPGHGVLDGKEDMILLMGSERSVTTITKGNFYLYYASEMEYHDIGCSAILLTTQFLLQLFIIPQGTLFGQIMFLSSLAVSWLYNAYLASLDSEALQSGILRELALHSTKLSRISFQKRTAVVVFIAVYAEAENPKSFLDEMIPNDTQVWRLVKNAITTAISRGRDPMVFADENMTEDIEALPGSDAALVWEMLKQASFGFEEAQKESRKLEGLQKMGD